jgi:hypothetical protein
MTDDVETEDLDETAELPIEKPSQGRQRTADEQGEREAFIRRIAVLTAHNGACEKALRAASIDVPTTPGLDQVRPTILAEGVVAELKRLQAELRLADQDQEELERERDTLRAELDRARVSGVGGGNAKAAPADGPSLVAAKRLERDLAVLKQEIHEHLAAKASLKDELAAAKRGRDQATDDLRKEQTERLRLEREVRRFVDEAKAAAKASPAPEIMEPAHKTSAKAAPAGDADVLLVLLRARGTAASASFLRDVLGWDAKRVDQALEQLVDAKRAATTKLGKLTQFKATP